MLGSVRAGLKVQNLHHFALTPPRCVTLGISLDLSELLFPIHKSLFSKVIVKIKEVAIARGWGVGG